MIVNWEDLNYHWVNLNDDFVSYQVFARIAFDLCYC